MSKKIIFYIPEDIHRDIVRSFDAKAERTYNEIYRNLVENSIEVLHSNFLGFRSFADASKKISISFDENTVQKLKLFSLRNNKTVSQIMTHIVAVGFERYQKSKEPEKLTPIPALKDIPSVIGYSWKNKRIVVDQNSVNTLDLPFKSSARDHVRRLNACKVLSEDLIGDISAHLFNIRPEYKAELSRYVSRLPIDPSEGSILLADAAARTIRNLFSSEMTILPVSAAARLRTFLEQHNGLRAYYPELLSFYRDVESGRLEEPLPLDAVDKIVRAVEKFTPELFGEGVLASIDESNTSETSTSAPEDAPPLNDETIQPPSDPLGSLDPAKARDFQIAGVVNRLWEVFITGQKVQSSLTGWVSAYNALAPAVRTILRWLEGFLNSSH